MRNWGIVKMGIGEMWYCFNEEMDVEEFFKRKIPISKTKENPNYQTPNKYKFPNPNVTKFTRTKILRYF